MLHLHHNTWSRTAYSVTSQSSMLKIEYITKYSTYGFVKYDMHDMATYQNVQFMEYEAYHCLDLIAPQLDVLSWPYKWNVLHNGFIPNHFNPSLQMSKGRHKGKIQLSIGLPDQTAHSHISNEKLFFLKINKTKLNFQYLQKHWVEVITTQHFWSSTQHNFYCWKNWEDRKKGREGENEKDTKHLRGGRAKVRREEVGVHLHTKIIHKDIGTWNAKIKSQLLTSGETHKKVKTRGYTSKGQNIGDRKV